MLTWTRTGASLGGLERLAGFAGGVFPYPTSAPRDEFFLFFVQVARTAVVLLESHCLIPTEKGHYLTLSRVYN